MLFMFCVFHAFAPCGNLLGRLLFVVFNCVFVIFPCGILGQAWYLIYRFLIFAAFLTLVICLLLTVIDVP